jgi:hypothetical protein
MTTEYIGFFNDNAYRVIDGNIVYAKDLNNPLAAIEAGVTALVNAVQTGATILSAEDTGAANAYVANPVATLTALTDGQMFWLKPGATNSGASTIDLSGLGVVPIRTVTRSVLIGGELVAGFWYLLKYSSTLGVFLIVSSTDLSSLWADYGVGGGITGAVDVSTNTTATIRYIHVLTALCTLTLPTGVTTGVPVAVINLSGNPNCTITAAAGVKINGIDEDLVVDMFNTSFLLVYSGASAGWVIV